MTAMLTDEERAKLVALEKAATPAPWLVRPREHDDWGWIRAEDGSLVAIGRGGTFAGDYDERERHLSVCRAMGIDPYGHNAALIAAARNALPALLAADAAVRGMKEALEEAEEALKSWRTFGCPQCGGDCAAANPNPMWCIVKIGESALAKIAALSEIEAESPAAIEKATKP